jgi:hypothetical protein
MGPAVQGLFREDDARVARSTAYLATQDVERIEVAVSVDPDRRTLSGECTLTVRSQGTVTLLLNEGLGVASVKTPKGVRLPFTKRGATLEITIPGGAGAELTAPATFTVRYQGSLAASHDVWLDDGFVYLGVGAHWYPAPPEFDPATYRIVVRYPAGYASVCTGALVGMAPTSGVGVGSFAYGDVWDAASPIPAAAAVVAKLESSMDVLGGLFLGLHTIASDVPDTLGLGPVGIPPGSEVKELVRFLDARYGPYPYEWLNVVSLPRPPAGAVTPVSAPGFVVTGEADWMDSETGEIRMDRVASALSDSWWRFSVNAGTLVSDGLGAYVEESWLESTGDDEAADQRREERCAEYVQALTDSGGRAPLRDCIDPERPDDRICRGKGAGFFRMLELLLGEDAFRDALKGVASAGGGRTVGLRELVHAFESTTGDLDWFFYEWVVRGDLPTYILRYSVAPVARDGYIVRGSIKQQGEIYRTPLPLTIDLGVWSYEEWIPIASSEQAFQFRVEMEPLQVAVDAGHRIPRIGQRERAALLYEQGVKASSVNEWGSAADEFGAASELEPGNAAYRHSHGEALVRAGRLGEGITALEAAVKLDPRNAEWTLSLAELDLGSGDHVAAARYLDAYVKLRPRDPVGFAERAIALVGLGKLEEAEGSLATARTLAEKDNATGAVMERVRIAEGRVAEANGDAAAAAAAYRMALQLNPASVEAKERLKALGVEQATGAVIR